ncbi:arginase family protein [Pantoea ananatis]|nr:arginase family protein [Pantoea ananatis]
MTSTPTPICTSASTWTSSTPASPRAGGPNYREAQLVMEMIADSGRMASLDIVELNPVLDHRNLTAELAVDLVESLFGKSTLMRD